MENFPVGEASLVGEPSRKTPDLKISGGQKRWMIAPSLRRKRLIWPHGTCQKP